ncbi:conserved hypothetical protein [Ricinus communis]|uniref:Uncharacterized protein n=1 Tax=Ricinus communis TaxID=3988 RepID=B9SEB8_RICCO|nr:conserved hypothetical protein [Ricinus communis]
MDKEEDNDKLQKQKKSKTEALPLNDASSEALFKMTHEDHKENIKNPDEALNDCSVGTVIASGSKEQVNFEKLKALLDAPVNCSIRQLHDKINRFSSEESMAIQGPEFKIQALLHDGDQDYKDFKNADQGESKKISFLDCLKEFDESDDVGYETLKALKTRAVNHGKDIFYMIIVLMFLKSKTDGLMAKFQVFGDALKWVFQGENTVVVKRLLHLLQIADPIMSHKKEDESKKQKAVLILGEEEAEGLFGGTIDQELEHDFTDNPILELLKVIFRLELFWTGDSKMPSVEEAIPKLEADMEKCEEASGRIELELKALLDPPVRISSNTKQLHDRISIFRSVKSKGIHGLEHKVHSLLHDGDEGESKKISFLEGFDISDGVGYATVESLKTRAINHGKCLFHIAINLMLIFINSKTDGMMAKSQG